MKQRLQMYIILALWAAYHLYHRVIRCAVPDDVCPSCRCRELHTGFGLAGGGYGVYWFCDDQDDCRYFYKRPFRDGEE